MASKQGASKVKDEIAREVEYMNLAVQELHDYATTLIEKGDVPFSSKTAQNLRERGSELIHTMEKTGADISDLAGRYECGSGETPEGDEIKQVAAEVAGEVGGLYGIFDLSTGKLPGYGDRKTGMADVGRDFMTASKNLKKIAARLAQLRIN